MSVPLSVLPNPQPLDSAREGMTLEESERLKKADCEYYESCLNRACKADWSQFHCGDCLAYRQIFVDVTQVECSNPSYSLVTVGRSYASGGRSNR